MKKVLKALLLVFWMALIFYFSSQDATVSGNLSGGLLELFFSNLSKDSILYVLIRKFAHVFLFFVLAILIDINISSYFKKHYIVALVFAILYCISDEIHQFFVPGRGCSVYDMLIDTFGASLALIIKSKLSKHRV